MDDEIVWTPELEIELFHSMQGHKPVGVSRHFQMVHIHDKLSRATNRTFTITQIWDHLKSMYNLDELNDLESNPFPMDQKDFCLPEDYGCELDNDDKVAPALKSGSIPPSPILPESPGTGRRKRTRTLSSNPSPASPATASGKRRRVDRNA
ncbi:MRG/MORF4L-binding protein-like [Oscarella lobularis]|uniref:MRG/MORF4L-binding protein-like n=1 Tax=Oscarella lobularis TaxID=121494 RepID=UPI0033143895